MKHTPFMNNTVLETIILILMTTSLFIFVCISCVLIIPQYFGWVLTTPSTEQVNDTEMCLDTPTQSVTGRLLRERAYTTDESHGCCKIYEEV